MIIGFDKIEKMRKLDPRLSKDDFKNNLIYFKELDLESYKELIIKYWTIDYSYKLNDIFVCDNT